MAIIYLRRGETFRATITAQNNGTAIDLDETWTVSAWMRPKPCGVAFDLSPTISDGTAHISYPTDNLLAPSYQFDIKFTDANGDLYTETIDVAIAATITPP
jgi:hypothetical protein